MQRENLCPVCQKTIQKKNFLQNQAKKTNILKVLLFPKMKILTQGWRFKNNAEIQPKLQVVLYITIKLEFLRCFQQWETHYAQYTNSVWGNFEGDNIDL